MPESDFFAQVVALGARTDDPTPKYLRIGRSIAEAIDSGRLRPGTALPSQREMADHLGVTVMTLRQALKTLIEQGHLRVEHGTGTFVADSRYHLPIDQLTSFTDQIRSAGRTLRTTVVFAGVITAPRGVPARMGLATDQVFCLTRVRIVDDVPMVYSMSLLPPTLGVRLALDDLGDGSLYDALAEQLDVKVTRAIETFRAALLEHDEATALDRRVGESAMVSSRLTFSADGNVVVDDRAIMPGDSVVVSTERLIDDSGVRLLLPHDPADDASRFPNQIARREDESVS